MSLFATSRHTDRAHWHPEWRRAVRALRALLDDPDSTGLALEIGDALDRDRLDAALGRLLAKPAGRELYDARPCLLDSLDDRVGLGALPEGSLGRAYLAHLDRHDLEPGKIIELRHRHDTQWKNHDAGLRWFLEREALCHDLAHVLSGYRADGVGEAALLFFTYGQSRCRSTGLLMWGAGLEGWRRITAGQRRAWPPYLYRAWRRGRNAHFLPSLPFESLLAEPLEGVRALARIEAPEHAHPGGVFVGGIGELGRREPTSP